VAAGRTELPGRNVDGLMMAGAAPVLPALAGAGLLDGLLLVARPAVGAGFGAGATSRAVGAGFGAGATSRAVGAGFGAGRVPPAGAAGRAVGTATGEPLTSSGGRKLTCGLLPWITADIVGSGVGCGM
jgi:hypothetical protein